MRVLVTSCETSEGAWRHEEMILRRMWTVSSRKHVLTEDPADAEVIIIGNLREENGYRALLENPVINKYPDKCFAHFDGDEPKLFLRGIYTSVTTRGRLDARFRSGSYALYHPDFQNPLVRDRGGEIPAEEKRYLFSFVGRNCHPVRAKIFAQPFTRPDVLVRDTSDFNVFTHASDGKSERQRQFVEILKQSKFALCPRGNGAASIRMFESMRMGVAPIVISDSWVRPSGVDWEKCAIWIQERDIPKLQEIAESHEGVAAEMGRTAADTYERCFSERAYFDYVVDTCAEIMEGQRVPERYYWGVRRLVRAGYTFRSRLARAMH